MWVVLIPERLREEAERFVVRYVFGYFRRERDVPSVAKVCRAVERKFKLKRVIPPDIIGERGLFPGRVREICMRAGIPEKVVEGRLARTRRATERRVGKVRKKPAKKPKSEEGRAAELSDMELADKKLRGLAEKRKKLEEEQFLAERKVEENRRMREAERRTLVAKAILDPRKIAKYIRHTNPQWGKDLDAFCKDERTTLGTVCKNLSKEKPFREDEDFDSYVKDLLHDFDLRRRKAEIRKSDGEPWNPVCVVCGLRYEYKTEKERDEKGNELHRYTSFVCPQGHEYGPYFCPFCRQLKSREVYMAYNVGKWALRCTECGELWDVKELVSPVGTYLPGEKPLSLQQARDAAAFVQWARKRRGGLHETFSKLSEYGWNLWKMESKVAELREEWNRLRAETSTLKEERAALHSSIGRLRREEDDLKRKKEKLEERIEELRERKKKLDTKIDALLVEQLSLSERRDKAILEIQRKALQEKLRMDEELIELLRPKDKERSSRGGSKRKSK